MYELLIEKTENGFRAIVFEIYEDLKSVVDILHNPMPWMWAEGKDGFVTNEGLLEGVQLSKEHMHVNFGRAKKLGSMVKKVCETL